MISNWKQELVKRAGELFGRGSKAPAAADAQKVIDDLHRKIGQLQVECDFLAGQPAVPIAARRAMIAPGAGLSVSRQCALLAVARSSFYYRPRPGCAEGSSFWSGSTILPMIRSTAAAVFKWRCCERGFQSGVDASSG